MILGKSAEYSVACDDGTTVHQSIATAISNLRSGGIASMAVSGNKSCNGIGHFSNQDSNVGYWRLDHPYTRHCSTPSHRLQRHDMGCLGELRWRSMQPSKVYGSTMPRRIASPPPAPAIFSRRSGSVVGSHGSVCMALLPRRARPASPRSVPASTASPEVRATHCDPLRLLLTPSHY